MIKIIFLWIFLYNSVGLVDIKLLEDLDRRLGDVINQKFDLIFQQDKIDELFNNLHSMGIFEVLPVEPLKIAKEFSKELAKEIRKKMKALEKSVKFAENVTAGFKPDPNIKAENVTFINSKELTPDDKRLVYSPMFNTKIIINQSSVHIPTEIYDGDPAVLNEIKWTGHLNEVFKKNHRDLRHQYFASKIGIVVHFPGMMWRRKSGVDMYDVRRRQWYVQGASSSKDVMVLIDTSGSMHGIAITLTKLAVQKLIDTMGENDYVAVAQFPGLLENDKEKSPPHLLVNDPLKCESKNACRLCFDTFVQASKRNKGYLFDQIDKLKAKGRAFLNDALEFAVNQFLKFDKEREERKFEGANCNRIIVVLTDGDGEYDREKLRALINSSELTKNIRIFIYSVGEEIVENAHLKNITCEYRGYFGNIRSYGAVSNIIEKFASVAHYHYVADVEPDVKNEFRMHMTINEDGFFGLIDEDTSTGLGLMTSLTMPVYNRTGNTTFLGLLGTDMTVAFMEDLVPNFKLGPNGYAFAINTNGFIIFHPELKAQRGWMPDPPNVDLTEIEFDSPEKTELRKMIIDSAASNGTVSKEKTVSGLIKVSDEIHAYEGIRTYAFTGVPLSSFGVSIVTPLYNKFYAKYIKMVKLQKLPQCTPVSCPLQIDLPNKSNQSVVFLKNMFIYAEDRLIKLCKMKKVPDEESGTTDSLSKTRKKQQKESKTTAEFLPVSTFGSVITESASATTASISISRNQGSRNGNSSNNGNNSSSSNQLVNGSGFADNSSSSATEIINSQFSMEFMSILTDLAGGNKCPKDLKKRIPVDLYVLQAINVMFDKLRQDDAIQSAVISLLSGVTMVYPHSAKYLYKDMFENFWTSSIFQRTFDMPDKSIFHTPVNNTIYYKLKSTANMKEKENVMIFRSYSIEPSKSKRLPIGVIGLSLKQKYLTNFLQSYESCNGSNRCYLLEDAGFVVAVNDQSLYHQIGFFFGDIEPFIMSHLLNNSLYLRVHEYDYQGSCPRESDIHNSASTSRLKPIVAIINQSFELFKIIIDYINKMGQLLKILLQLLIWNTANAQEATATDNENISCITEGYRYYTAKQDKLFLELSCNNCNFTLAATKIKSTNLVLLSYENKCNTVGCNIKMPVHKRKSNKDIKSELCHLTKIPKYRVRPKHKCYSFDNKNFLKCSSNKIIPAYILLILTFFVMTLNKRY